MLEKGTNKAQKSYIFDSLDEAQHYQALYGGKISILRKQELKIIEEEVIIAKTEDSNEDIISNTR